MKYMNFILAFTVFIFICSPVTAEDLTGDWNATVTESFTYCENLGKDYVGNYSIRITQTGNVISIVGERGITWTGIIKNENSKHAHVRATFNKDGGYVTELIDIDFDASLKEGRGGSVWTWTDGLFQCGGSFKFKLKKK